MDIREIMRDTPAPHLGLGPEADYLSEIVKLQTKLLEHYTSIESLPPFPVRADMKVNQVLLKDFISRIVEELGESFENLDNMAREVSGHCVKNFKSKDTTALSFIENRHLLVDIVSEKQIFNFIEELSDALHFYIELLIYMGIPLVDKSHQYSLQGLAIFDDASSALGVSFEEPFHVAVVKGFPETNRVINRMLCLTRDNLHINHKISSQYWLITYELQLARNCLKNKPWKQSEMESDKHSLIQHTMDGFRMFLMLLSNFGYTSGDLYNLYYWKHQVNLFRIASHY